MVSTSANRVLELLNDVELVRGFDPLLITHFGGMSWDPDATETQISNEISMPGRRYRHTATVRRRKSCTMV
jgi:hypothetical protein